MKRLNSLLLAATAATMLLSTPLLPVAAYSVPTTRVPRIIQGGMGVRISSWQLAREVSKQGQLGVISGTAMDTVMIRCLQAGDLDGSMRRALQSFPDQDMVARLMDKYYVEGGKAITTPFKGLPMWTTTPPQQLLEASVVANYCEVWLAKHNPDGSPISDGVVGMNLLTKVQLPTIPSLYGAMLADVDYILMGAGIPMQIPKILDQLAVGEDSSLVLDVEGTLVDESLAEAKFSPSNFWKEAGKPDLLSELKRPNFLPIVSSVVLAQGMLKRASGTGPTKGIDGFVVELPTAGGHNAPPRGFRYDAVTKSHAVDLNDKGEPVYGVKDEVSLEKFSKASKGLPFWLAGSYAKPDKFAEVLKVGGAGVQVGTAFALSKESGMHDETKQRILHMLSNGDLSVYTDPVASPTGFPFKVLELENTLATDQDYKSRPRVCNLGYLRTAYVRPDGKIGYRCASEPLDQFLKKGGAEAATEGRKCLCNALCADAGMPQVSPKKKDGELYIEQPLVTIGDDVNNCRRYMKFDEATGRWSYSAVDVIDYLMSEFEAREAETQETTDTTTNVPEGLAEYLVNESDDFVMDLDAREAEKEETAASTRVVSEGLAEYIVSDWEAHEVEKDKAPAPYLAELKLKRSKKQLSKADKMSEACLPKGMEEYLMAAAENFVLDLETREAEYEETASSTNVVSSGLAEYMLSDWEAHEAEKATAAAQVPKPKEPKKAVPLSEFGLLAEASLPTGLEEYLVAEWEAQHEQLTTTVATKEVPKGLKP